jgi:hypothetical protein
VQPPGREQQGIEGRLIEPLGIVDHTQQRRLRGQVVEQRQGGGTDQEPVVDRGVGQAERGAQRSRLRPRQRVDTVEVRAQQQVQAAEGQLGLGLDTHPADHPQVPGRGARVLQQGGLADPRFAHDDQRVTAPGSGVRKQLVEAPLLALPPHQHAH